MGLVSANQRYFMLSIFFAPKFLESKYNGKQVLFMNIQLVELKNNEAFTTSKIIAEGANIQHESVVRLIKEHLLNLERWGKINFSDFKSGKRGRPTRIFYLNEQQATLLITFLDNTETVISFKTELVDQFFKMRDFIRERKTLDWQQTRVAGKTTRLQETDVIKQLAEYAKKQGSEHSDKLYLVYSKLAKTVVKNGRNELTITELNTLNMIETMILKTIQADMCLNMGYKQIYQDCKNRLEQFKNIMYLAG